MKKMSELETRLKLVEEKIRHRKGYFDREYW